MKDHEVSLTDFVEDFVEDFIEVFPEVLQNFETTEYQTDIAAASYFYEQRMIQRFWKFFGLISLKGKKFTKEYDASFVARDILEQVFEFRKG